MVSARITLGHNGPISFHGNGRKLARGESIVTTNPSEIRYFQTQQGFTVTFLEGKMSDVPAQVEPKPAPSAPVKVAPPAAVQPPVKADPKPQTPTEPDQAVDEDDGLGDEDSDAEAPTADQLMAMTKNQLVIYGKEHGINVSMESTKAALVNAILDSVKPQDDPEE